MAAYTERLPGRMPAAVELCLLGPLLIATPLGCVYWLWMSFQMGSLAMFTVGFVPPFFVVTGPVGLYALVFGPPDWLFSLFG